MTNALKEPPVQKPEVPAKKMKGYSTPFILALAFLFVLILISQNYILKIIAFTREHKPYETYWVKDYSNLWVTIVGAILYIICSHFYFKLSVPFWARVVKRQDDDALRKKYARKCGINSFKVVWIAFITIYGYSVIRNTPCHHFWIGGNQTDWEGLYVGLPFHDDSAIFMFCLINHSYHLASLVKTLFFEERMNDFETIVIHHVACNTLLISSNFGACYRYGVVVLFIHDITELPVALVRVLDSLEGYKKATVYLGYLPMILGWFYFRLLYFPWIIYGAIFYRPYPKQFAEMDDYLNTQVFFLSCLLILHIMWFKMMIGLGLSYLKTGTTADKIQDIEGTKNEAK